MKAVEMTGTVTENGQLILDEPVPVPAGTRVRLVILLDDEADLDEREWLRTAAANPAFDFLHDPEEDIYTLADGEPFPHEP